MIRRIYVDNYKSLVNFDLSPDRVNLVLGGNGAGKTSIAEVLHSLSLLVGGYREARELFPTSTLTRWQSRDVQVFEIEISGNGGVYHYRLEICHPVRGRTPRVEKEVLRFGESTLYESYRDKAQLYRDNGSIGPEVMTDWNRSGLSILQPRPDSQLLTWFKKRMARIWVLNFYPERMAFESREENEFPEKDLSNFVSWLRHLSQEQQDDIHRTAQVLRDGALPGFESFRLAADGENRRVLFVKWRVGEPGNSGEGNTVEFRFDELSDGQRVLVALYTILCCAVQKDTTLCLDQPESYLGLPEINPWLDRILDASEEHDCQLMLISHHPELVNALAANAGFWLERTGGGPTRVSRVTDDDQSGLSPAELIARGWLHA